MTFDDLLPYILPHAKACPESIALLNARLAVVELCEKARVWKDYQSGVDTVADTTAYAYAPAEGQRVVELLEVTLEGIDVPVVTPKIGRSRMRCGESGPYVFGTLIGFELHPAQAEDMEILTYSVVAPTRAATTIPDAFERFAEGIAQGALARLLADKDKAWSDPNGAVVAASRWSQALATAQGKAFDGHAQVVHRTRAHWF